MIYHMVYPYMLLHRDMFICYYIGNKFPCYTIWYILICYSIWYIFLCYYIGICSYGISSYVITYGICSYVISYVRSANVIKYCIHCHVSMFENDHVIIILFLNLNFACCQGNQLDFSKIFLLITMVTRFEFYYVIMFSSVFPICH